MGRRFPNHAWAPKLLTGAQLAARFGLEDPVADVTYVPGMPGKPAVVRLTTADGRSVDQRLTDVRTRLGLKSTRFRLGVLRLDPPARIRAGGAGAGAGTPALRLTGLAREVDRPLLEQRTPAGAWVTVKRLKPAPDGTFTARIHPGVTTVYRLSADGLDGPSLTVRVGA